MAGGKLSPRQKMINMMYLVLTAMLALNVSAEILKAFHNFEVSMQNSGANLDAANVKLLSAMDKEVEKQGPKAQPFRDKAYQAKKLSDDFYTYIESIKTILLVDDSKNGENPREPDGELKSAKDMEIAVQYFMENRKTGGDKEAKGKELMSQIVNTRESLLGLLDEGDRVNIKSDLRCDDPPKNNEGEKFTWLEETFHSLPLAAAFANLTKYQNDAKKTESDVIAALSTKINATDFKFDALQATIVAPFGSVTSGQPYTAEIFLSAFNSKQSGKVFVNGNPVEVKDGKGMYKASTGAEGTFKVKAEIEVVDPLTGQPKRYAAESEYQVFSPVATISASKMSIFYAGIDNPVDISVPGFRPNQVQASCSNGAMTGANGKYNVKVQMGPTRVATINVVATMDDKTQKSFVKEFKIRPLPPLAVTVNGKEGGGVAGAEVQVWSFLNASFGPSFAYDGLQYSVNSYQCIVQTKQGAQVFNVTGPAISPDLKSAASRCRKGDLIIFFNIKASSTTAPAKNIDSGPVFRMQ
jgi:gliding motility-associated protein GldM